MKMSQKVERTESASELCVCKRDGTCVCVNVKCECEMCATCVTNNG